MTESAEFDLIARCAAVHEGTAGPLVEVSIGDDAAVLAMPGRTVWTVDAQVDHVHFERAWLSAEDMGFRAHAAATSDVYAMGASPVGSLASYILSPGDSAIAEDLARGARASAQLHGAPVIGGNMSRGSELSITTTVVGTVVTPVLRSGAMAGDLLLVAGLLGYASLGLRALRERLDPAQYAPFIDRWRRPRLPVSAARELAHAHAAIDVSDGLSQDLAHVLDAAQVGAILDADDLVDTDFARACADAGVSPLDLVLHGGEDYALIATAPRELASFRRFGIVTAERGLRIRHRNGLIEPLQPFGHVHRF